MTIEPNTVTRTFNRIRSEDNYLIAYLLGWTGDGEAQPWGAAHSFALEMGKAYGLIASECDSTPTDLGRAVAKRFCAETPNA